MPLVRAIRLGSLHDFDAALSAGEPEFVKRRIYLTLERGRDICLRNLLRKVCLHQGWKDDGQMRKVSVSEFVAAVGYSERGGRPLGNGEYLDRDEVECQLANMIYKVCQPSFPHLRRLGLCRTCDCFLVYLQDILIFRHLYACLMGQHNGTVLRQHHPSASSSPAFLIPSLSPTPSYHS